MQAAFILAVFGALFFVITSMTSSMVETTQQLILRQEAQVRETFTDVERLLNEVLFKQDSSVVPHETALAANGLNGLFESASLGTKWSVEQLARDPWNTPYNITFVSRDRIGGEPPVAAFGANRHATPVVHYFTLSSPGRDRTYQTQSGATKGAPQPSSYQDWVDLRAEGAMGDDIIHTFSTRDAMLAIWNRMNDVHNRMSAQLRSDYISSVDAFLKKDTVRDAFDSFYSCVARGATANCAVPGKAANFSSAVIQACINANTTEGIDWPTPANYPAGWPSPGAQGARPDWWPRMTTANCWMAEPEFRNNVDFPSMVEQAVRSTNDPNLCRQNCQISAAQLEALGLGALRTRDPMNGIGLQFSYTRDLPTLLLLRREVNEPGWEINLDIIIDGERTGT